MHLTRIALLTAAIAVLLPAADEFDALIAEHNPPARFADHTPAFSVSEVDWTFQFSDGPKTWQFWVVKDGDKFIAYAPKNGFHGGSIFMLTNDPAQASTELDLPTERFHIDTARGCSFRTDHFLPTKNWGQGGETSAWTTAEDGSSLTLTRTYAGELKSYKWELDTRKSPLQVDHKGTFVLTFDKQLGYVLTGTWETGVDKTNNLGQYVSLYPPNMSNPWVTEGIHERVMTSPNGSTGYIGHANNHPAIDVSDNDKGAWSLRNGGFTSYLDEDGGWSWTMTMTGATAKLSVCNVHADQDLIIKWPKELSARDNGLTYHTITARLLKMPPELTKAVWDKTEMKLTERPIVVVPLGKVCDFEDQPRSQGEAVIGMTWGGGQPTIATGSARSGTKSLQFQGTCWPTLPQIALKPGKRYRLEGWFKIAPATAEDIAKLKARHEKGQVDLVKRWERAVKKAKKRGKEPPAKPEPRAWTAPEKTTAWMTAHLYRWTPHNIGDRLIEQITTKATEGGDEWQKVELEFDSPAWGPFVDIRFVCAGGGTAWLDDFSLTVVE